MINKKAVTQTVEMQLTSVAHPADQDTPRFTRTDSVLHQNWIRKALERQKRSESSVGEQCKSGEQSGDHLELREDVRSAGAGEAKREKADEEARAGRPYDARLCVFPQERFLSRLSAALLHVSPLSGRWEARWCSSPTEVGAFKPLLLEKVSSSGDVVTYSFVACYLQIFKHNILLDNTW